MAASRSLRNEAAIFMFSALCILLLDGSVVASETGIAVIIG